MKKERTLRRYGHLVGLVALVIGLASSFFACSDKEFGGEDGPDSNVIWDFSPIILYFQVQDADGNDLLNPETSGNICGQKVTAHYKGETYEKDSLQNLQSRYYMAHLYGLYTNPTVGYDGKHRLAFGEFPGEETFKNEQVTLMWEDGTKDVFTFSSNLKWENNEPVITRSFTLNGKDNDGKAVFVLTKKPATTSE